MDVDGLRNRDARQLRRAHLIGWHMLVPVPQFGRSVMSVLYVTGPDEDTGMVAAITDEPCPCGWPETVLHIMPNGATTRGCPSCETETQESEGESDVDG